MSSSNTVYHHHTFLWSKFKRFDKKVSCNRYDPQGAPKPAGTGSTAGGAREGHHRQGTDCLTHTHTQ